MQIRKRGLRLQIVRRLPSKDGKKMKIKIIGSFPMSCDTAEDVRADSDLFSKLTKREEGQLEEYLEKRLLKRAEFRKRRIVEKAPIALSKAAKQIQDSQGPGEVYDIDNFLEAYRQISDALGRDGYAPELVAIAMESATKAIDELDLEKDHGEMVISAWLKLKVSLEKQGYTTRWYNSVRGAKN